MRHNFERHLGQTCDIIRRSSSGSGGIAGKESGYFDTTVESGIACALIDSGTEFARIDGSGERIQRPAQVRLPYDADVQEGDTIDVSGESQDYEVRGIERARDPTDDQVVGLYCDVERAD